MEWYEIAKHDILTSYRIFIARVKAHPLITIFFLIIAIAGIRLAVYIGLYLDNVDMGEEPIFIERWVFSIIFFSFIFGKVALYTYRKILKEREMLSLFSQPINFHQISAGKYLANIAYISVLLVAGFILFYGWLVVALGPIWIPLDILVEGILLTFLGLSLGFTLPIFLQLKPVSKKFSHLGSNVIIIGAVSIPLRFFPRDAVFFSILTVLTMVSFWLVHYSSKFLLVAWNAQLSKPLTILSAEEKDRLKVQTKARKRPWVSKEAWLVAKKELISLIREKDAIVTIVSAIFLAIASVVIYFYFGPTGFEGSRMGAYLYPGILAIFLFLGTLMISALIGLAMISVEGRAFYIIKSLPVSGLDVLKGKSIALLVLGFPIILPMAVLLPIVAKFPLMVTLFYLFLAIVFIFSFTGIGIWGGTRLPNFDPTARNMPDLISQFFIMSICVICSLIIVGVPAVLMVFNNVVGVMAILVAIGWSLTILIWALDRGAVGYDEIDSDMYM
ncbi:hypothetical protein [[Eubacterium] cellulosolvens]